MRKIPREQLEQIAEAVLIKINQDSDNPILAEQTQQIMNAPEDYFLLSSIMMANTAPPLLEEKESSLKHTAFVMMASAVRYLSINKKDVLFNEEMASCFNFNLETVKSNYKLNFALSQFALAYSEYDKIKEKYPELMNALEP